MCLNSIYTCFLLLALSLGISMLIFGYLLGTLDDFG